MLEKLKQMFMCRGNQIGKSNLMHEIMKEMPRRGPFTENTEQKEHLIAEIKEYFPEYRHPEALLVLDFDYHTNHCNYKLTHSMQRDLINRKMNAKLEKSRHHHRV